MLPMGSINTARAQDRHRRALDAYAWPYYVGAALGDLEAVGASGDLEVRLRLRAENEAEASVE